MLPCLLDPSLRALDARVLSCVPAGAAFAVRLDTTPFYPEGGGQPADHGWLGEARVLDVQTDAGGVVHTVDRAVSGEVVARVDRARRFDHMQQHTAQHLLTALAQDRLGLATVGFHLGEAVTTIDLDGPLDDPAALQAAANDRIRAALPVTARVVSLAEYGALAVRSRGLPEGHAGAVRLVGIEGLDLNTCGGTHVASTAALQLVHIARLERHKGGTRLHFLAGGRALAALDAARDREDALSRALTAGPEEHLACVQRLQAQGRDAGKRERALLEELGGLLGREAAATGARHVHRPEADLGLLKRIADAALADRPDHLLLLTGGEGAGVFLLAGPVARVQAVGPAVAAALGGRGGGRGDRYQGKASDLGGLAGALGALGSVA